MANLDMLYTVIQAELEDAVGSENVRVKYNDCLAYGSDCYWLPRMWADKKDAKLPQPDYVVFPGTAEEVSRVLKIANYYKIPVVPWGGGSGSQGGAVALSGGIMMDMKRMNKLIDISVNSGTITVEAGMIFQQMEWYANEKGYSVMHVPSCITCCTVGGAMAHNGIGIFSTKYGKIDDMVINFEGVLPNGDIVKSLPVPKHSSGPDIRFAFIGAEGTMGVITKATFRMVPLPEIRSHHAFLFKDFHTGIQACRDIVQTVKPSIMRLFDEPETGMMIKKVIGFEKKGSFMNLTLEGRKDIVAVEDKIVMEICEKYGAEYIGREYGEKWFKNRVTFFYPGYIMDVPQMFGTMDTTATFDDIEKCYVAMKSTIENEFENTKYIAHCSHWYDWGTMIYDRFIIDNPPEDPQEALLLHNKIWFTTVRKALENGGTLNDHHGIGMKLSYLMQEQYGKGFQILQALKKALDPNGIMNPYKTGL